MVATKYQEREALQQIKAIVESLGEGSYIGMAFEGVWEIAEDNIEKDFGMSCKSYIDMLHEEEEKTEKLRKSYEDQVQLLKHRIVELEDALSCKERIIGEHEANFRTLEQSYETAKVGKGKQEAVCASLRYEVLKLKAKLYDLLISED